MGQDKKRQDFQALMAAIENQKKNLEAMNRQIQLLGNTLSELGLTNKTLEVVAETKKGTTILVPIGSDSFVRATLADSKQVLVGVGSGVTLEKSIPQAKQTLTGREEEVKNAIEQVQAAAVELSGKLASLNREAEEAYLQLQHEH